jgi:hypothetical protein
MMSPELAHRITRLHLAKEFNMTPKEIDELDEFEIADMYGYLEGQARLAKNPPPKN